MSDLYLILEIITSILFWTVTLNVCESSETITVDTFLIWEDSSHFNDIYATVNDYFPDSLGNLEGQIGPELNVESSSQEAQDSEFVEIYLGPLDNNTKEYVPSVPAGVYIWNPETGTWDFYPERRVK